MTWGSAPIVGEIITAAMMNDETRRNVGDLVTDGNGQIVGVALNGGGVGGGTVVVQVGVHPHQVDMHGSHYVDGVRVWPVVGSTRYDGISGSMRVFDGQEWREALVGADAVRRTDEQAKTPTRTIDREERQVDLE